MAHRPARELGLAHVALVLYALSLGMPALVVHHKPMFGHGGGHAQTLFGVQCLLAGVVFWPGWLANPLLYAGALLHGFGRHAAAVVTLGLALVSALLALALLSGDSLAPLEDVHVGYVAWLASIALMFAAAVRARMRAPRSRTRDA